MVKKLIEVDPELYKRLKIFCIENNFKMRDVINDIFEKFLKEKHKI